MEKIEYVEKKTLENRWSSSDEDEAPENFVVATKKLLSYFDGFQTSGCDNNHLYCAIENGKKVFLERSVWCASGNYSAEGTSERIVSLEKGIEIIMKQDPEIIGKLFKGKEEE